MLNGNIRSRKNADRLFLFQGVVKGAAKHIRWEISVSESRQILMPKICRCASRSWMQVWNGSFKDVLEKFENDIRKHTLVNEEMKNIIDGFPKSAHPMGVLASLTSALTALIQNRLIQITKKKCMMLCVKQWLNF